MKIKNLFGDSDECWNAMGLAEGASTSHRQLSSEMTRLNQTIEGEIIPRLMVMFDGASGRSESASAQRSFPEPPYTGDIREFVSLLLDHPIDVATRYITVLMDDGAQLKNIYLDLLAPAARHLGKMWESDECNFAQVTVGVARMHQLLHMFSPCFCAHHSSDPECEHSALIVPMPGEQHTFGHLMVVEFFRSEGWTVWSGSPNTEDEILQLVSEQAFSIVGISISADRHLDRLKPLLHNMRLRSLSDDIKILLGGRAFLDGDRDPKEFGADGFASDGEEAVQIANGLV